jgi:hypothetical protein
MLVPVAPKLRRRDNNGGITVDGYKQGLWSVRGCSRSVIIIRWDPTGGCATSISTNMTKQPLTASNTSDPTTTGESWCKITDLSSATACSSLLVLICFVTWEKRNILLAPITVKCWKWGYHARKFTLGLTACLHSSITDEYTGSVVEGKYFMKNFDGVFGLV